MKSFVKIRRSVILISLVILLDCTIISIADESEEMLILGSALTKLSAAVESTVRYKNPPTNINDAELLALATKHDPTLLKPFANYTVRVLRQNRHAIILICTGDGKNALMEDAGCTSKLDEHLWEIHSAKSCEFTLTVSKVCKVN